VSTSTENVQVFDLGVCRLRVCDSREVAASGVLALGLVCRRIDVVVEPDLVA
jgi:hypothetical protein